MYEEQMQARRVDVGLYHVRHVATWASRNNQVYASGFGIQSAPRRRLAGRSSEGQGLHSLEFLCRFSV